MGEAVQLKFTITQHSRDVVLMESLIKFFNCGNLNKRSLQPAVDFVVGKFPDIVNKIMPLFINYPLQGVKHLDSLNFVQIIQLMQNKAHLTKEGLDKIKEIKSKMNRGKMLP